MVNVQLTHKAIADLSDIWDYTYTTWSEEQADKYYSKLLDTCNELAKKPELGKKYDGVYPHLLGYKVNRHIIFYIVNNKQIIIVRILHSRMDLKNRLNE